MNYGFRGAQECNDPSPRPSFPGCCVRPCWCTSLHRGGMVWPAWCEERQKPSEMGHQAPLRSRRVLEKIPLNMHSHPETRVINAGICIIHNYVACYRGSAWTPWRVWSWSCSLHCQNSSAGTIQLKPHSSSFREPSTRATRGPASVSLPGPLQLTGEPSTSLAQGSHSVGTVSVLSPATIGAPHPPACAGQARGASASATATNSG